MIRPEHVRVVGWGRNKFLAKISVRALHDHPLTSRIRLIPWQEVAIPEAPYEFGSGKHLDAIFGLPRMGIQTDDNALADLRVFFPYQS